MKNHTTKKKTHRWRRRDGERLQIGESVVTIKFSGTGRGRRALVLVETDGLISVTPLDRVAATVHY
jgi:hypothetical protein